MEKMIVRGKERTSVSLPANNMTNPIVFDFMAPIVGDQFRTDPILSKQLFRSAPVNAPFMLTNTAYTLEAQNQLKDGNIVAALEAYKFALDSQTSFIRFVTTIQDSALMTRGEKSHLDLGKSPLGNAISSELRKRGSKVDKEIYSAWVDEMRTMHAKWLNLNHTAYGSAQYIRATWEIGMIDQAILLTTDGELKRKNNPEITEMAKQIRKSVPQEVLNVKFLRKYIEENYPESSMG